MPLKRILETPGNPLRPFLKQMFPGMHHALREGRKEIADAKTIVQARELPWALLGTAIDYRVHYYFEPTESRKLTAYRGARFAADSYSRAERHVEPRGSGQTDEWTSPALVEEFFEGVDAVLKQLQPMKRRLPRDEEELLDRYCFILALFEEVYRGGESALYTTRLLGRPKRSVEELLQLAPPVCVRDLRRLSYAFWEEFHKTIHDYTGVVLNPSFEGSPDVGGADGDLILNDALIDIKSSITLNLPIPWLYQVLSYALLDYSDSYGIRNVGFYLARQRRMLTWSLEELTMPLQGRALASVDEIRSQFRDLTLRLHTTLLPEL